MELLPNYEPTKTLQNDKDLVRIESDGDYSFTVELEGVKYLVEPDEARERFEL